MEEIEIKLYSNNPVNVSTLISKIINNVKKKHENGGKDFPEVKFLKEKLILADPLISEVAGLAIIHLIKDGILSVDSVLTDFLSTMNSIKCYSTLTNVLGDLLYLQLKNKNSPFNLHSPQHPFIILINERSEISSYVLNKLCNLQEEFDGGAVTKIFEPFYMFSLCCPLKNNITLLKYRLWTVLLNSKPFDINFYMNILSWLQVQRRDDVQIISDQLIEALNDSNLINFMDTELLILWQVNVLYNLALNKLDMQPVLNFLNRILDKRKLITVNCILLILSHVIDVCSPLHLKNIFKLCKTVIDFNDVTLYAIETVKASVLVWVASPCTLTSEAYIPADYIITLNSNKYNNFVQNEGRDLKKFNMIYKDQICTNKMIFFNMNLVMNLEIFSEKSLLREWLVDIRQISQDFVIDIFNFLCGILMVDHVYPEISIITLELLLKCTEKQISLSSKLLTLILFKIPNNPHPTVYLALLKSLPKLVILRDNIPKVIAMIHAISKGSENLFNIGLSLAYDAWAVDSKCYVYLEDLLVKNTPVKKHWERNVLKAYILKGLCENKPEFYGKDVIAHLSKILNECDDDQGALPCALAIEAITILCRVGVIDIKTTWSTLEPKFRSDMRFPVVKSLCALITEIPQLSYTEDHKDLFNTVTKKLWKYVEFGDSRISEAALLSLTSFGMEHICHHLPEKYLESGSVSNMQSISGKTWIRFLIENCASIAAINFMTKMMSIEIDGFLKYVYQMKGPKEPINYSYLPSHSVVRAIGEFIKTWVNKWRGSIHDKLYIECLKIFSEEFNKPLPPLDWCFLQELFHDSQTKGYAIDIASHQVVLSGTARRLIENYLSAVTSNPQGEEILYVYKNVKYLARSIQPMVLRPFFETSLWQAIKKYNQGESKLLIEISVYLKTVLRQDNVQETNKITIVQVLDSIIFVTDINTKLFGLLCDVFIVSPSKCLEAAVNFKVVETEESFQKIARIRCALAESAKNVPLNWLNDVIDVWSTNFRNMYLWPELASVFKIQSNNTDECVPWFLELVGQIQAKTADRCEVEILCFLFDVLIFAVVHFSGLYTFVSKQHKIETKMKDLFPAALGSLLDRHTWEACSSQVLEWLYHMNSEESIPKDYRTLFGISLQALKHNDEFTKNQRSLKYLSSLTHFE